ncbi:orotate phosphoribosyltransferase [Candidatus Micrarchaeota archaeon]|nr:MAG: orotate phosphoribosyltransferase [Candidatus Micrarchaeota archaeon]
MEKMGVCSICGKGAKLFTCSLCGREVCAKCYVAGACIKCLEGKK